MGSPKGWAESWQRSWDRLEEELVPDREVRLGVLLDVVEAVCGASPMIVDLGCGPGTVTCRLLDRLPGAGSIAVDVDPVLLAIASATFAGDDRVEVVRADLRDQAWWEALLGQPVDAVVTATALHLAAGGHGPPSVPRPRRTGPRWRCGGTRRADAARGSSPPGPRALWGPAPPPRR